MDYLTKVLSTVGAVAKAVGGIVDQAVPSGVGQRTSIAVVAAAVLPYVKAILPAQYQPAVDAAVTLAATLAPLFAAAHVVR